jgi:hypothetical protein
MTLDSVVVNVFPPALAEKRQLAYAARAVFRRSAENEISVTGRLTDREPPLGLIARRLRLIHVAIRACAPKTAVKLIGGR